MWKSAATVGPKSIIIFRKYPNSPPKFEVPQRSRSCRNLQAWRRSLVVLRSRRPASVLRPDSSLLHPVEGISHAWEDREKYFSSIRADSPSWVSLLSRVHL